MQDHPVTLQVRALEAMDLEQLRAEWRRRWGASPRLRSPELLAFMIAWRLQSEAFGGLELITRRDLRRAPDARPRTSLAPGVRLAREWRGERCEVEVVENGFRYQGEVYASLSKIAGVITGTKWNGPRFFGLTEKDAA